MDQDIPVRLRKVSLTRSESMYLHCFQQVDAKHSSPTKQCLNSCWVKGLDYAKQSVSTILPSQGEVERKGRSSGRKKRGE